MEGTESLDIFKPMAESINSQRGGPIAGKNSDKLMIMSNSDSPCTIASNQAATIINATGLGVFPDLNEEHHLTSKISIIVDNSSGESMKIQTPAEKKDQKSSFLDFKPSNSALNMIQF
eukprot:11139218-Ditylum_brightwellii.AAC.1